MSNTITFRHIDQVWVRSDVDMENDMELAANVNYQLLLVVSGAWKQALPEYMLCR